MIRQITFKNFKALRDTKLPLGQLTLMVGPNGSGKSTVFQALLAMQQPDFFTDLSEILAAGARKNARVEVKAEWSGEATGAFVAHWDERDWKLCREREFVNLETGSPLPHDSPARRNMWGELAWLRVFSLDAEAILRTVELKPAMELQPDGSGLAGVLERLRDEHPERFEALNVQLKRWLPEFDRILIETPLTGLRAVLLRITETQHHIRAKEISQGTLLALALLTLAYLSDPPPILCLEEPDRGIHPRLLRDVRDAMYRLAYPEHFGEDRKPVQVIATTHSPYMLDLFRDHPEEIVIAHKEEGNVIFERLSDRPDLDEILQDTHLGDAWYSGILGGVPTDK